MKNIKYIWLLVLVVSLTACEEDDLSTFGEMEELPALTAGDADFSNYVALGASFTAGFTDNALFIASQENSFPIHPYALTRARCNSGCGSQIRQT